MPKGVRVQVPSRVPCGTTGRKAAWIEDSRGLCIGDGFEQSPGEGEETDNSAGRLASWHVTLRGICGIGSGVLDILTLRRLSALRPSGCDRFRVQN